MRGCLTDAGLCGENWDWASGERGAGLYPQLKKSSRVSSIVPSENTHVFGKVKEIFSTFNCSLRRDRIVRWLSYNNNI